MERRKRAIKRISHFAPRVKSGSYRSIPTTKQASGTNVSQGLVQETKGLFEKYGSTAGPLNSLGYKQVLQLIQSKLISLPRLQSVQQAHRNYAKRQMTWFRREPNVIWLEGFGDDPQIQRAALAHVVN